MLDEDEDSNVCCAVGFWVWLFRLDSGTPWCIVLCGLELGVVQVVNEGLASSKYAIANIFFAKIHNFQKSSLLLMLKLREGS